MLSNVLFPVMSKSNFLSMKFKWKLLILKWVILSESLCFYPRSMRTSGFIVFLQIVFCFESLRLDNTKTALDLASRGKTYLVLMPVVFLFIFSLSVFLLFVTSLRKFIFRTFFSATKELDNILCWQESGSYLVLVGSCGGGCFVRFT